MDAESDFELLLSRTFDAPKRLVFEAWTKAEHLMKWFGPKDFTVPTCNMEFRSGGVFTFTLRGPDGVDYPFDGELVEIVTNERIVFRGDIHDGNNVTTTVTFAELDGKTTLTVRHVFTAVTASSRGARIGWGQTLDHLAAYVAKATRM